MQSEHAASVDIFTTWYAVRNRRRLLENKQTLLANAQLDAVAKLVILFQGTPDDINGNSDLLFLKPLLPAGGVGADTLDSSSSAIPYEKMELVLCPNRQTYAQLWELTNRVQHRNHVCVIVNTDILFDSSLSALARHLSVEKGSREKSVAALTRWEAAVPAAAAATESKGSEQPPPPSPCWKLTMQAGRQNCWSFDAYAFLAPLFDCESVALHGFSDAAIKSLLDIQVGVRGCDTLLVKRLVHDLQCFVFNPCLSVLSYHIDSNQEHNYTPGALDYWAAADYPGPWNQHRWHVTAPNSRGVVFHYNEGLPPCSLESLSVLSSGPPFPPPPQKNNVLFSNAAALLHTRLDRRVIAFSLWGSVAKYTVGAVRCAEQALEMYPDFECWFYVHRPSVPPSILQKLEALPNVVLLPRADQLQNVQGGQPRTWRYEAIDAPGVEVLLSRDVDTRFYPREALAVREWLRSGIGFHIMRDHPHHGALIMAGMYGCRRGAGGIRSWSKLLASARMQSEAAARDYDTVFLADHVYPRVAVPGQVMIHDSFNLNASRDPPGAVRPFPIPYDERWNHVGGYVFEDESTSPFHVQELATAFQRRKDGQK
jgi:hypothetical protein